MTTNNCMGEHCERKLLVCPGVLRNTLLAAIAPRPLPDLRVSMGSKKSQKWGRITFLPLTLLEQLHTQNRIKFKIFLLWHVIYFLSQVLTESWITISYIIDYLNTEI